MKEHIGKCDCCSVDEVEIQHFDLLVLGSEGIWLCNGCRTALCDVIWARTQSFMRAKRDAVLERKRKESER